VPLVAEQAAEAEQLCARETERQEEVVDGARLAAEARGRDLGQVGGDEAAGEAALHALQEAAELEEEGRELGGREARGAEDGGRAQQREEQVEEEAVLAAEVVQDALGGECADEAAEHELGKNVGSIRR